MIKRKGLILPDQKEKADAQLKDIQRRVDYDSKNSLAIAMGVRLKSSNRVAIESNQVGYLS